MNQNALTSTPRRVALYARYSTDLQNRMSVEDQFRQGERHARQRGWTVVERFCDRAISGTVSKSRPGFQALTEALSSGAFDIVLIESIDRISRDLEHTAHFYKLARFHRVEMYTLGRGKVDGMTLGLSSTMAAMYLEDLSFKTRRGLEGRVAQGLSGGGRSYGYRQGTDGRGAPVKGKLEIDETEASVVRRIFREYADGTSPLKIAAALNTDGIPSPAVGTGRKTSGHWKQNTINGNRERGTGILNNELYIGRRVWNRQSYEKNPLTEKRVARLNPAEELRVADVPHLRIVDQDLWDAVKERQASQTRRRAKLKTTDRNRLSTGQALRRRKYLFSGLLHCGLCGGAMTVAGTGKYKAYYCANAKEKGASVCEGFRGLHERKVAQLVLSTMRTELMQPAAYALFRDEFHRHLVASQGAAEEALREHDARTKGLETKHRAFIQAIEKGADPSAVIEPLNAANAELQRLRATRDALVPPPVQLPENLPELYRALMDDLAATLSTEAVVDRASDAIHELVDWITVRWDAEAAAHRLEIEGNLLEMLKKSAPNELGAVRDGKIFAEVGCGGRI